MLTQFKRICNHLIFQINEMMIRIKEDREMDSVEDNSDNNNPMQGYYLYLEIQRRRSERIINHNKRWHQ